MTPAGSPFSVAFERRDFSGPRTVPGMAWEVQRLEWRAVGGPWQARLSARALPGQGGIERLHAALDLLRCGVTVCDRLGPAWWGYVSAVTVIAGGRRTRASLDGMVNDLTVRYRALAPEPGGGEEAATAPAVHAVSMREYGRKSGSLSLGQATLAQAEAFRAVELARRALPQAEVAPTAIAPPQVILECRGWWETLDWLFYTDPRGRTGSLSAGTGQALGGAANRLKWAQSFAAGAEPWTLTEVWVRLRKEGAPLDNLRLEVTADGAGSAPGAVLASASVPGQALSSEWDWARFALAAGVPLSAGGSYWVVMSRDGAFNTANHYLVSADLRRPYPGGVMRCYDGTAWIAAQPEGDMAFLAQGTASQGGTIARIIGQCGQFLAGLRLEADPGLSGSPYREGRERGRAELEVLLRQGTAGGERLLASVEPDRWARVFACPGPADPPLTLAPDGSLRWRGARPLLPSEAPAARWAALGDLALSAYPDPIFIESCAWEGGGVVVN